MKQLALMMLGCALAAQGCEKDKPPAPAATRPAGTSRPARLSRPATRPLPRRPETQPSTGAASRPTTTPTQPATTPGRSERFDEALGRIGELESRGEFTRAWKLAIETRADFAGHPRLKGLNELMGRLRSEKRRAAQLAQAVQLLGSDTVEASQIAASTLIDAGRLGVILLRKAVRTAPEKAAAKAVRLLVRLKDPQAATTFHERRKADPPEPLRSALLEGLRDLAEHIPPAAVGELYASVKGRPFGENLEVFGILAAAYERAAGGDPNAFAKLTGDPNAAAMLKATVSKAMSGEDEAEARAASGMVASLGLIRKGLRGSYYRGANFEKLLFQRLESRIFIENGRSPYPDGRGEQISVRWTGQLRIRAPGSYTFYAASDDGVRLWVAGKQIVNDWRDRAIEESTASIDLTAGLHPIRMEFYQGNGDFGAYLKWSGPGIEKQLLTDEHLLTPPWGKAAPPEPPKNP